MLIISERSIYSSTGFFFYLYKGSIDGELLTVKCSMVEALRIAQLRNGKKN